MFFSMSRVKGFMGKMRIAGLFLVILALALSGCSSDDDDDVVVSIYGTWEAGNYAGDIYVITASNFTSKFGDDIDYAGTIENIIDDGPNAGFIVIKFTEHSTSYRYAATEDPVAPMAGRWYVIHYKDLTASTVELSGAWKFDDDDIEGLYDFGYGPSWDNAGGAAGKETQIEAESTYVSPGLEYFYHAAYKKITR